MTFYKNIALLLALFLFIGNSIASGKDEKEKKSKVAERDTTTAFVMYGNQLLLANKWGEYDKFFDLDLSDPSSYENLSEEMLEAIALSKSLEKKNPKQLHAMIDSLFDLDNIPYALINEINFQIALIDNGKEETKSLDHLMAYNNSKYPAHDLYNSWDTEEPLPRPKYISHFDNEVMVQLIDQKNNCEFHMPFEGVVTSKYGWRDGRTHHGYDIDLEVWDPVHASFSGVVRLAKYYGAYGRLVIIRHYNGLETFYAHLHRFKVKPGDIVEAGDVIGLGGSSGRSTGSHLHYEMRYKGIALNPGHIISFNHNALRSDTLILSKTSWGYNVKPKGVLLHYVEKGENLSKISDLYGIDIEDLCDANNISRNSYLRKGQRLVIQPAITP